MVQTRAFPAGRATELAENDLREGCPRTGDEDVQPAIVVVVPEPAGEAGAGLGHAEPIGDIGECGVAVIVVEPIILVQIRDVEVGPAIVVVVAPSDALGESVVADPG